MATTYDERIATAKAEAKRFLARVAEYEGARDGKGRGWSTVSESGALKRSSMDLTRALADLRKGNT